MSSQNLNPEQLAMLTEVVNEYCYESGIEIGSEAHERAAILALHLYKSGFRTRERLAGAIRFGPLRR